MTEQKVSHTPGPWHCISGSVYCLVDENGDMIRIARVVKDEQQTTLGERDANARLIAAAPNLLEAARYAYDQLPCTCGDDAVCDCAVAQMGAAIAKAEGR